MNEILRSQIIIVEDDESILTSIKELLVDNGYKVECATNGKEAFKLLRAVGHPLPSLIVLDIMMPVMDGYEFLETQLQDPTFAHIPVVVMTAGKVNTNKISAQVKAIVNKPINIQELLDTVERFCG